MEEEQAADHADIKAGGWPSRRFTPGVGRVRRRSRARQNINLVMPLTHMGITNVQHSAHSGGKPEVPVDPADAVTSPRGQAWGTGDTGRTNGRSKWQRQPSAPGGRVP